MRQWRGAALLRSPSSQQQRPAWLRRAFNHALRPAAVADKVGSGASQPAEPTPPPKQPPQQQHNPPPPEQQPQQSPQLPPPQQQHHQQDVLQQWEQPQEDLQQWEQMRQQVLAFQQAHGWLPRQVANKLGKLVEKERLLGVWCTQQRRRQEGSKGPPLSAAQVAALEAIPGWLRQAAGAGGPHRPRVSWELRQLQVAAFFEQHGRWPRRRGSKAMPLRPGEKELGNWCNNQRQRWKGTQKPPLTPEQVAALEAMDGWVWEEWRLEPWEARYQQVAAFRQQHGRFPRQQATESKPFEEGEQGLGNWCDRQRQRWRGNTKPPLTPEQVAALEALPDWRWDEWAEVWEERRKQFATFVQQHGRLPRQVGSRARPLLEGEKELGRWCSTQRLRWRGTEKPPLTPQQVAALESLTGWRWDEWAEAWEERRQQVAAFVQQHGRLPRKSGSRARPLLEGEKELGYWLNNQRVRLRGQGGRAALSAEQLAASISGWRG